MIVYEVICFDDKGHNDGHYKMDELRAELSRVEKKISDIDEWMLAADEFRCKMMKKKTCIENEITSMKIANVENYLESKEK